MRYYDRVSPLALAIVKAYSFVAKFETISHFLSPREPPPSMLLDRTDEEDGIMLPSSTTRKHHFLTREDFLFKREFDRSARLRWHYFRSYRSIASCDCNAVLNSL